MLAKDKQVTQELQDKYQNHHTRIEYVTTNNKDVHACFFHYSPSFALLLTHPLHSYLDSLLYPSLKKKCHLCIINTNKRLQVNLIYLTVIVDGVDQSNTNVPTVPSLHIIYRDCKPVLLMLLYIPNHLMVNYAMVDLQ